MTADLSTPLHGVAGTLRATNAPYQFPLDNFSNSCTPRPVIVPLVRSGGVVVGWQSTALERFYNVDFEKALVSACRALGSGKASCESFIAAVCGGSAPAMFVHDTIVRGYSNGSRGANSHDTKTGGCHDLVHHQTISRNGYNGGDNFPGLTTSFGLPGFHLP